MWTWMRYSYCWGVIPHDWAGDAGDIHKILGENDSWPAGALVSLDTAELAWVLKGTGGGSHTLFSGGSERMVYPVYAMMPGHKIPPGKRVVGRAAWLPHPVPGSEDGGRHEGNRLRFTNTLFVDARSRGRLTGASVAGLVVGAMGVFVLAVALRHWLGERRRFLADTRRHNQSVDRPPSAG
jgi:hypothetical protein